MVYINIVIFLSFGQKTALASQMPCRHIESSAVLITILSKVHSNHPRRNLSAGARILPLFSLSFPRQQSGFVPLHSAAKDKIIFAVAEYKNRQLMHTELYFHNKK